MANPPITIGPFTNVPAPGSPIKSDWPQSVSTYVDKLPRGYRGYAAGNSAQVIGTTETDITGASLTVTIPANRMYLATATFQRLAKDAGGGLVVGYLRANGNAAGEAWAAVNPSGTFSLAARGTWTANNAPVTFKLSLMCVGGGTVTLNAPYPWLIVEDIGPTTPI